MKLTENPDHVLRYGALVKTIGKDSKYAGITGKIVDISTNSAKVTFEGFKKPVTLMINALERI